jgi:hypothetical protein
MILLKDLKPIISNGSTLDIPGSRNIFIKNGDYYVNFCHRDKDGTIALDINNNMFFTDPQNFRKIIYEKLNYFIPDNVKIFIAPCYPKKVEEKYGNLLREYNIEIIGDWDSMSWSSFCSGEYILSSANQINVTTMNIFIRKDRLPEIEENQLILDVFNGVINDITIY